MNNIKLDDLIEEIAVKEDIDFLLDTESPSAEELMEDFEKFLKSQDKEIAS